MVRVGIRLAGLLAVGALVLSAGASGPSAAAEERPAAVVRPAQKPTPPPAAARSAEPVVASVKPLRAPKAGDCALAEAGDGEAAYRLARRYLFGIGVAKDQRQGVAWLRAAAGNGDPTARRLVRYVPPGVGRHVPSCGGRATVRGLATPPAEIVAIVDRLAPRYGLDPKLVLSVIRVESGFRTDAVSPKEAAGLMQLIPETAARFAVADVFDPEDNIHGGMRYLRWLLAYFEGDVTLALAAYNAGEGAVDRFGGIPPYAETRNYVATIRSLYATERHPYDPNAAQRSPLLSRLETGREPG